MQSDLVVEAGVEDGVPEAVPGDVGGVFPQCLQGVQLGDGVALVLQHVLPRGVRLLSGKSADPLEVRVNTHPQYWHLVAAKGSKVGKDQRSTRGKRPMKGLMRSLCMWSGLEYNPCSVLIHPEKLSFNMHTTYARGVFWGKLGVKTTLWPGHTPFIASQCTCNYCSRLREMLIRQRGSTFLTLGWRYQCLSLLHASKEPSSSWPCRSKETRHPPITSHPSCDQTHPLPDLGVAEKLVSGH